MATHNRQQNGTTGAQRMPPLAHPMNNIMFSKQQQAPLFLPAATTSHGIQPHQY